MTTNDFLSHFPGYVIQTFDDSTRHPDLPLVKTGRPNTFTEHGLYLLNKYGAGIFFSVNRFNEGVRRQHFCDGVNAWFAECDTLSKEEQWHLIHTAPLKPTFVVESKKSLHIYYLSDGATKENFKTIQLGLCAYYHGDTAMSDIARVMRMPGYYHMKDPNDPFLVSVVLENEQRFCEARMIEMFPYVAPVVQQNVYELPPIDSEEYFWEIIRRADNKMILEQLSGNVLCNSEVFSFRPRSGGGWYIDVNGKPANAWIDSKGLIGSGSRAGPTWVEWLRYYGVSYSQIARWVKHTYNL